MQIRYLSFGISKTGGYRHEKHLFETVRNHYAKQGEIHAEILRQNRLFTSLPAYLTLMHWAYRKSTADLNIVTGRCALPAILRNLSGRRKVWIVLHNFDPGDGKGFLLSLYYRLLFYLLRKTGQRRFRVVCVAPYWLHYFSRVQRLPRVSFFPNLFDHVFYRTFVKTEKKKQVHLGQFSSKNDPKIFDLAAQLSRQGYYCYFSTLIPGEACRKPGRYDVLYFSGFRPYLEQMSQSVCTLALSRVREGWNRLAHESILVGTPVIGYQLGGLGDLLLESKSLCVDSAGAAYQSIVQGRLKTPDPGFAEKYDISHAEEYIQKLCEN